MFRGSILRAAQALFRASHAYPTFPPPPYNTSGVMAPHNRLSQKARRRRARWR